MRLMLFALLSITGMAFGQVTETKLYRTVMPDGSVVYSDRPQADSSELIAVGTSAPPPAPDASEESDEEVSPEIAAETAANCARARESLATVLGADSLFRVLPDGERHFLTAEETAEARANAEAEVARWCDETP